MDKEAEVARQKAIAAGLESKKAAEEYEWNVGAVQKRKMQAAREHLKKEAAKPLARYAVHIRAAHATCQPAIDECLCVQLQG